MPMATFLTGRRHVLIDIPGLGIVESKGVVAINWLWPWP